MGKNLMKVKKMANWKLGDKHRKNKNPNMLEGLPSIAEFLGKSAETTRRWILKDGLPATKLPNGRWLTHKGLILQWIYAGHQAIVKNRAVYTLEAGDIEMLAEKMDVDPKEVFNLRDKNDRAASRSPGASTTF